jgi:hypothetical protein
VDQGQFLNGFRVTGRAFFFRHFRSFFVDIGSVINHYIFAEMFHIKNKAGSGLRTVDAAVGAFQVNTDERLQGAGART